MTVSVFVDESGDPSQSGKASDHFVLGAAMVRTSRLPETTQWLLDTRKATRRAAHHELHWKNIKAHHRGVIADALRDQTWGRFTTVVVCKRHLPHAPHLDDDRAYLYAMRFLCERVSWFARSHQLQVDLTIAHRIRFKSQKLTDYDARLRADPQCQVDWRYLNLGAARLDQPKRLEQLQIADLIASSTASGFEPDSRGVVHPQYLQTYRPRLYCPQNSRLTSYGLKMHPWSNSTRAAYPWVAAL